MKTFRRFWRYMAPHARWIVWHGLFAIAAVVMVGSALALLDPLLQLLFQGGRFQPPPVPGLQQLSAALLHAPWAADPLKLLSAVIIIIIAIHLMGNLFRVLSAVALNRITHGTVYSLRKDIFDALVRMDIPFLERQRRGDLISRTTADVNQVEHTVEVTLATLIREPFTIAFFLTLMVYYSWQLTLFIFVVLPPMAWAISSVTRALRRDAYHTQDLMARLTSVVEEYLTGIRVVKAFNAEGYIRGLFRRLNQRYHHTVQRLADRRAMVSPISETAGVITVGLILWFGARQVLAGHISASGFMVFIFFFQQIMKPAKNLSAAYGQLFRGMASARRIFEMIDQTPRITTPAHAPQVKGLQKGITFEAVYFRYPTGTTWAVQDLSFDIPRGRFVALVGPSGAGKTTIVELLFRFYDPQQGTIRWDDRPLTEWSVASLRRHMALVTQDPILFNDTVFNNIAFGLPDVSRRDVEEAARIANAHDFIVQLPQGYDTVVGDMGALLSGGQRQRISIARAVLRNPDVLVLDEATSSLDTASERAVQAALSRLMEGRTAVVIAHRLSTIRRAHQILVVDKGRIVEQGSHDELMVRGGAYAQMVKLQQLGA